MSGAPRSRPVPSTRWAPWQARIIVLLAGMAVLGLLQHMLDVHLYLPRLKVHREVDSLTLKHMGWDRVSLGVTGVKRRFQETAPVPGDKLQPLDVRRGSRDATVHRDIVRPSPYRSEGVMKPFAGDLAQTGTLQQALEARSHKKEVILVHFRDKEIGMALNMVLNLRKLTFEHFLLLTLDESSCQLALSAFPKAGCVWSTYLGDGELEYFAKGTADHHNAHERLILIRYHTIARMIRAGYNILSVHADSHFSDDPYVYVKGPHLNKATLLTMSHGGWTGLTSGFIYVQGAAVSGPVSWIFTETVDRILRYAENPSFVENEGSAKTLAWAIDDELIFKDAVASAYLGRPVGWHTLWAEGRDSRDYTRDDQNLHDVWQAHAELATQKKVRIESWIDDLGGEVKERLGFSDGYTESFRLSVPRAPKAWDQKLGGSPFPPKRRKASTQWHGSSAGEVSVLTGGLWDEAASELLVQPLMYGKFMEYGHNGLRNGAFYVTPRPFFFAHVMGIRAYMLGRSIVMKAVGMWHWEATAHLEALQQKQKGGVLSHALASRRVLAFAPDALPLRSDGEADFRAAVMGLVQLAVASGRTPVWPDVACDSAWLDDPAKRAQRKASNLPKKYVAEDWRGDLEIVPRLPLDGPPDTRRCLVWYYYDEDCDSHGMSLMDFFYVRDQVWKAGEGDPRENNTILLQPEQSRFAELRTEADVALLKSSLDGMASKHVVYLGQEVRVRTLGPESKAERKLKEVQESCLDRAFHLSMDRVNYRASDSSLPEAEQQEVLQEIKKLENPEAAEGERAAAVEAAQLLQKPAREEAEEDEEPGTEGARPRPGEKGSATLGFQSKGGAAGTESLVSQEGKSTGQESGISAEADDEDAEADLKQLGIRESDPLGDTVDVLPA